MNYTGFGVTYQDFPEPSAVAVVVYLTGCSNGCPGCQNKELQDQTYGESIGDPDDFLNKIISACERNATDNVVFEGGDPLFISNAGLVNYTVGKLRKLGIRSCVYTGCGIDEVKRRFSVRSAAYYKCGKYDSSNSRAAGKDDDKIILASPNQNFYDERFRKISKKGVLYFNDNIFKRFIRFLRRK